MLVVSDEVHGALFALDPKRPARAYELFYPGGVAVGDAEALAPIGDRDARGFYVVASQGLTQAGGREKAARDVVARIVLARHGRSIRSARLSRPIRKHLLEHLREALDPGRFDLGALRDAVPDAGGLNIEGAALYQRRLVLGLRSPCASDGSVVLVPIAEPERLFGRRAPKPSFEAPILARARRGEGIRSLTEDREGLLVLLGPSTAGDRVPFRIARWRSGRDRLEPVRTSPLPRSGKLEGTSAWGAGRLLLVTDRRSRRPADVLHFVDLQ